MPQQGCSCFRVWGKNGATLRAPTSRICWISWKFFRSTNVRCLRSWHKSFSCAHGEKLFRKARPWMREYSVLFFETNEVKDLKEFNDRHEKSLNCQIKFLIEIYWLAGTFPFFVYHVVRFISSGLLTLLMLSLSVGFFSITFCLVKIPVKFIM